MFEAIKRLLVVCGMINFIKVEGDSISCDTESIYDLRITVFHSMSIDGNKEGFVVHMTTIDDNATFCLPKDHTWGQWDTFARDVKDWIKDNYNQAQEDGIDD